ncbi:hypothetical protein GX586_11430 [bacterium]|nr:hypothetical protein [bacterium]
MSHVHVSGLTFRFNNNVWDLAARSFSNKDVANASIRLLGPGTGISIRNCRFEHVSKAVRINATMYNNTVDDVVIADNEILYTDHGALELNGSNSDAAPYGPLRRLSVLRNRMYMIGMRPYTTDCHGHAVISEFPESAEFAGNILDRTYGSGLFIFGGKGSGNIRYVPFSRILIHHNRVTDSLLNCNDWGGIETWQGGPFYLYGNISGNPGGYWHPSHVWAASRPASERTHTTARLGFAYYLDGSFKNYVFNNVAWGNNNNLTSQLCNTSGFETVLGFQNLFFNNTIYKFGCGYMRQADCSGRNAYIGNLWLDLSAWTFYRGGNKMSDSLYDYENLAYGRNIFHGLSRQFGIFEAGDTARNDFNAFKNALASRNVLVGDLGFTTNASPVQNAAAHDFRPGAGSSAIEYGARSFVPWALYQPVGEWQFRRGNKNPALLLDENWYMTHQYTDRTTYYQTPRYHLTGVNINADDYVQGPLENWCCGALRLNGTNQYASVSGTISDRLSLDIGTANFLVEAYIATVPGHTGGVIAAKCDATGYIVDINELGCARLQLRVGGTTAFTRASSTIVNDGQWHHVIAELNRQWPAAVSMYVDGVKGNGEATGAIIQPNVAVTNGAPFVVGKGPEGGWFAGTIEYLRVARGTLADAQTTIDELYEWQFNGPAYKDFRGTHAYGVRDAGAFEHAALSPLPRIVRQPQGFIVDAGGPVKLRVRAEQAAFYQWRKDNAAIPGATNEDFSIASAQPPDEGGYDVIVSNALGGVTSAQASLNVIPEPAVCAAALAAAALVSARRRRT